MAGMLWQSYIDICGTELTGIGLYWSKVVLLSELNPSAERVNCREGGQGSRTSLDEEGRAVPGDFPDGIQSD